MHPHPALLAEGGEAVPVCAALQRRRRMLRRSVVWHLAGRSAWTAFGTKVAMAKDTGQVDFLTQASVSSANKKGLLDIGTLCLNMVSGDVQLQAQWKMHIDQQATRSCSSGSHLYKADGGRCSSHYSAVSFPVTCSRADVSWRRRPATRRLSHNVLGSATLVGPYRSILSTATQT